MTTFTTNTRASTDLHARGHSLADRLKATGAHVWRLIAGVSSLFARRSVDPVETLAKTERREAARRSADTLLLR